MFSVIGETDDRFADDFISFFCVINKFQKTGKKDKEHQ